jgi:hypothetical protein
MFQEWEIQLELISDSVDNIKCYFKDFITYFTYIGKFIYNIILFIFFPIYYFTICLYFLNKFGTYSLTNKFFNKLFKNQGKIELHGLDEVLNRGIPKRYKNNIKRWIQNNTNKTYDYNKPETSFKGDFRI